MVKKNNEKIKAAIFDLDNTLYSYNPCHSAGLKAAYEELNKEHPLSFRSFKEKLSYAKFEVYKEHTGTASMHKKTLQFKRLVENNFEGIQSSLIIKMHNSYWKEYLKNMSLKEGVIELFKHLESKGVKIGIASDLSARIQLVKVKKLKIEKYLDALVTSEEAGSEKPHAIMFLSTLNQLNVKAEEAIMIGDNSISDVEGAKSLKIKTVQIVNNKTALEKEKYKKPDFVVKKFKEIKNLIDKLI